MASRAKQLDGPLKGKLTSIEGAASKGDVELARRRWNALGNGQRDKVEPHLSQQALAAIKPPKQEEEPLGVPKKS